MIGHNDDVETTVQAYLLEAIHELTNDLIHTLERFNQLEGTSETDTNIEQPAKYISFFFPQKALINFRYNMMSRHEGMDKKSLFNFKMCDNHSQTF